MYRARGMANKRGEMEERVGGVKELDLWGGGRRELLGQRSDAPKLPACSVGPALCIERHTGCLDTSADLV